MQRARREAGLNQAALAMALGLSVTGYSHYERGRQAFSLEQLLVLSRALHRPVQELLGLPMEPAADEEHLLAIYRSLSEPDRPRAVELLIVLARKV